MLTLDFLNDHDHKRGQGLVEYALILVLVAVVAISALLLLGGQVADVYCGITADLSRKGQVCSSTNTGVVSDCPMTVVSNDGLINAEAVVDNPSDVHRVEFYDNGILVRTEFHYKYCLGGGNNPCGNYTAGEGSHNIEARVYSKSNTSQEIGSCQVSVTIPK